MTLVKLFSSVKFDPFNPDPELIVIGDIAHSLSNLCQFNGHSDSYFSFAEHSVLVSWRLHCFGPQWRLMGLLLNAPKAYLNIPDAMKIRNPDLQKIEDRILDAVFTKFGLPKGDLPTAVAAADMSLIAVEARELMNAPDDEIYELWRVAPPQDATDPPKAMLPHEAHGAFLREFEGIMEAWDNA